ncbi:MAG: aminoglycoside phosphotransferase family protein [Bacteroidales bacterium]|nr:aminoglycoside phosphotransferase family protein [Bacteroidales bacterium]
MSVLMPGTSAGLDFYTGNTMSENSIDMLKQIAGQFKLQGNISNIVPVGSGHIHSTYRVFTDGDHTDDYLLQQLNTHVFQRPDVVMQNISKVTEHIRRTLQAKGTKDARYSTLTVVDRHDGSLTFTDSDQQLWRCFLFIPGQPCVDRATSEDLVYEGGKAYGNFLQLLSNLPTDEIGVTISRFHDLAYRLSLFNQACSNGMPERVSEASWEIAQLKSRTAEMLTIQKLAEEGKIPLRIVHHDTKINNVLFDREGKALCVIDLDTVMPGLVHDDFGDSIRTFTNTGEEDDAELNRVGINLAFYTAYASGFLEATQDMLTDMEKEYLALSARVMTYMQVLRFLTDYLNGDVYYRIHHPGHNLQRSRAQLALLLSMEKHYAQMQRIIRELD